MTVEIEVSLALWVEILLLIATLGLAGSALDMNFPIVSNLFDMIGADEIEDPLSLPEGWHRKYSPE